MLIYKITTTLNLCKGSISKPLKKLTARVLSDLKHCCSCFKHYKKIIYCTYPIKTNAIVWIAVGLIIWLIVWYRTRSCVSTETPLKILTQHNAAQHNTAQEKPIPSCFTIFLILRIRIRAICIFYAFSFLAAFVGIWKLTIFIAA